tara:strand:+ start:86 stop:517 length:432 start_codon:yes stop_codon:yes gene_type:complete
MKKKTNIRTIIRKIVREEVAMAIDEVITELKQPSMSSRPIIKPKSQKKIIEKKNFSKNSVLNDILNETASEEEWKTMGGGTYTSDKMNEVVSSQYGDMMNNSSTNTDGSLAVQMGVNPNDPTADFLKKDYRAVMKAIDKKKGK